MKEHQTIDIKQFHHFIIMLILFPLFIIDYKTEEKYYEKR